MNPAIIEAAARAMMSAEEWSSFWSEDDAKRLVAAAAPLIEAAALEQAAEVAEEYPCSASSALPGAGDQIAAAIRALKQN